MPPPSTFCLDPATLGVLALYALLFRLGARETRAGRYPTCALDRVRPARLRCLSDDLRLPAAALERGAGPLQLVDLSHWRRLPPPRPACWSNEFGAYGYHRAMHRFRPLWRLLHQMHHSAERLDVAGSFWFSPLDMVAGPWWPA